MTPEILLKRAYAPAARADGFRVLVDGLWPRGLAKTELAYDLWAKELAPSKELRQWFGHDPARWAGFRKRYAAELVAARASRRIAQIVAAAPAAPAITLVYGAKDTVHNQAVVLAAFFKRAVKRAAKA